MGERREVKVNTLIHFNTILHFTTLTLSTGVAGVECSEPPVAVLGARRGSTASHPIPISNNDDALLSNMKTLFRTAN